MKTLRAGVIGVGSFGELHLQAYDAIPGVDVVAVCDADAERCEKVAREYQIPDTCAEIKELCRRPDLDLISIVTPEDAHVEPVRQAASAGKHIFLEKPIANSIEDSQSIIDAAEEAGVFLMIGHILRFEHRYASVKRLIDEGDLGRVVSIHARRNRARSLYPVYGNRVHGLIVNGIHDLDLCLWYLGSPAKKVRAFTRNIQGGKNPDINWGFVEFDGGAVVCLETHWMIPEKAGVVTADQMQVIGTRGVANIDFVHSGLDLWKESGQEVLNVSYDAWFQGRLWGPLVEEVSYFCECVRNNRRPSVITPSEAQEALRLALALVESAERETEIVI